MKKLPILIQTVIDEFGHLMFLLPPNLEKVLIFYGKISKGLTCFDSFCPDGFLDERWGQNQHPTRSGDSLKPATNAKWKDRYPENPHMFIYIQLLGFSSFRSKADVPMFGYNRPCKAKDIQPFSSETTMTRASLTRLRPTAAWCRVPSPRASTPERVGA
ncbi:MAG: hypothetical protein PVF30_13405, partial [Desulfobacterales bacterium]